MFFRLALPVLVLLPLAHSGITYQRPSQAIEGVLNAPATPSMSLSPARNYAIFAEPLRYPLIADLAEPMLRLAGLRINPRTNGPHLPVYYKKIVLKRLEDGTETAVALPPGARPGNLRWSPDGSRVAFTNTVADRIELWVIELPDGKARRVEGVRLNLAASGPYGSASSISWADKNRTLLVPAVPANRPAAPIASNVPSGPNVQESSGAAGPVRTYQDMLQNPHDEALFDHYAAAQLVFVDLATGKLTPIGAPGIYTTVRLSPDDQHLLTVRVKHPYSYLHPVYNFPKDVEIWSRTGKLEYRLASLPLEDRVPIEGVPTGPRDYMWQPSAPAAILWLEALDGGDPRKPAPNRDRVMMFRAPFSGEPVELVRMQQRVRGLAVSGTTPFAMISDYERDRRWTRTFAIDLGKPGETPQLLWERNIQDRYKDPGTPVIRNDGDGGVLQAGDWIYLRGLGASNTGDHPFLDRYNVKTKQTERIFRSGEGVYETFEGLLDDNAASFVTRRESPDRPPNYFIRTASGAGSEKPLTNFADPTPQLKGIQKRLVTYERADGVPLSFTLYLPPGYKPGTRLPTVVWAYPLEYNDAGTAGQISGSTERFTTITGPSHLFFLLEGYAILDGAAMPVIGTPETVNNTYLEQIVADARAAIDKAVEIGVTDPNRVGVGGHSYGAFMTANLLAHSNLFRAGIARSGAYNRTLTPFGFQSERRTLWQSPDVYLRMSPFLSADKIKTPILLIHGEADNNTGTFPIQSERMYQAIRGNGGTVRYVTLPFESHGYSARESVEHTLWEMISWFDKHVKNASGPPASTH
jgi:dipeptidyl aminopeptidase/acylaminoacyl peptidase